MNRSGEGNQFIGRDLMIASRAALLDALEALEAHRDAVIVIGAQAIYLRTKSSLVALAEATKDSDLAIDPRGLEENPKVEEAMTRARFYPNPISGNPGEWMSPAGVPVDLMVPEAVAGPGGSSARGARIPPHSRRATRRAVGLEAALIDNDKVQIAALDRGDTRVFEARVAGVAALLVAKLHKIGERAELDRRRLIDKDAHDVYRLLVDSPTAELSVKLEELLANDLSRDVTIAAIDYLRELFAAGPDGLGAVMAGRAEEGVGDPAFVAQAVALLATDLVASVDALRSPDRDA
ncbi:hypothetical protein [Microbacterium xanthum]|uniref:hypothetical protein n=1 Tax=Microbacterium xanthum TaxID=3079794 RepID=UPI002AD51663|nr:MULTISPECIES: hypothetical protein [unclassified Microbacterium]MDZ8171775.1 hypothetical protein [Microbacterium sp. KSW-48]MDZ8200122.1 hypothetical protein [Microbacterium sp. SSW1-59]